MKTKFTKKEIEQAKQWIADVYHCSGIWGTLYTHEYMIIELTETEKQKDPGDYSPPVEMYRILTRYWNKLARAYPN